MMCYLCDFREATLTTADSKIKVCRRCNDDYLTPITPTFEAATPAPKVDKAPPKSSAIGTDAGGGWYLAVSGPWQDEFKHVDGRRVILFTPTWRAGGCIFCGKEPRPTSNKMGHGDCFRNVSEDVQELAKRVIAGGKS